MSGSQIILAAIIAFVIWAIIEFIRSVRRSVKVVKKTFGEVDMARVMERCHELFPIDVYKRQAQVNAIATGGLVPDLTVFLDLPPAVGMARKQQEENQELDRLEQEKLEFHQKVYEGYDALCKKEPERICRIDASGTIEEVFGQIKAALDELLDRA